MTTTEGDQDHGSVAPVPTPPLSTREVAALVDGIVGGRVLVHGSLPGEGRDLDLLVRPVEANALRAGLLAHGFAAEGTALARFRGRSVELVECIPAAWWDLAAAEEETLFGAAIPLEGYRHLCRPAPAQMLNLLARRIVEGAGRLDAKRRGYVDRALQDDPSAWTAARSCAEAWGGERPLALLERLSSGGRVSRAEQARVVYTRMRAGGRSRGRAAREVVRLQRPRPARAALIISGPESVVTFQSVTLAATLGRMGYDVVTDPLRPEGSGHLRRWADAGRGAWLGVRSRRARHVVIGARVGSAAATTTPASLGIGRPPVRRVYELGDGCDAPAGPTAVRHFAADTAPDELAAAIAQDAWAALCEGRR